MNDIIDKCPNCKMLVFLPKKFFNCKIYRHGIYKDTFKQIDPHLNKIECDRLSLEGLIIGCGKPFKIGLLDNEYKLVKCDYI